MTYQVIWTVHAMTYTNGFSISVGKSQILSSQQSTCVSELEFKHLENGSHLLMTKNK